jgi:hypothetical protein
MGARLPLGSRPTPRLPRLLGKKGTSPQKEGSAPLRDRSGLLTFFGASSHVRKLRENEGRKEEEKEGGREKEMEKEKGKGG